MMINFNSSLYSRIFMKFALMRQMRPIEELNIFLKIYIYERRVTYLFLKYFHITFRSERLLEFHFFFLFF